MVLGQAGIFSLDMVDPELLANETKSPSSSATAPVVPTSSTSLFSTISNYLAPNPALETAAITAESEGRRREAADFLRADGRLDELFRDSRFLEQPALMDLLQSLLAPLLAVQASGISSPKVATPSAVNNAAAFQPKEATLVLVLELLVNVSFHNRDRISLFFPLVYEGLGGLVAKNVSGASSSSSSSCNLPRVREHAVIGLGRLCLRVADRPEMQGEVARYFQLLCHVPPESFQLISDPALSLAVRLLEADPMVLRGPQASALWPHYFTLVAGSSRLSTCHPHT